MTGSKASQRYAGHVIDQLIEGWIENSQATQTNATWHLSRVSGVDMYRELAFIPACEGCGTLIMSGPLV